MEIYEEIMREVKSGKIKGEDLELAYSNFKKILDAVEDEMTAFRRMSANFNSDAIDMAFRKKRQELEALEELVSTIRRQL
jgi:chemotaxis protein histidine kinase CheA